MTTRLFAYRPCILTALRFLEYSEVNARVLIQRIWEYFIYVFHSRNDILFLQNELLFGKLPNFIVLFSFYDILHVFTYPTSLILALHHEIGIFENFVWTNLI